MHDAVACSTNDPVRVAPWLLAALRACPAVVIALGSIRRNCIAVWHWDWRAIVRSTDCTLTLIVAVDLVNDVGQGAGTIGRFCPMADNYP